MFHLINVFVSVCVCVCIACHSLSISLLVSLTIALNIWYVQGHKSNAEQACGKRLILPPWEEPKLNLAVMCFGWESTVCLAFVSIWRHKAPQNSQQRCWCFFSSLLIYSSCLTVQWGFSSSLFHFSNCILVCLLMWLCLPTCWLLP